MALTDVGGTKWGFNVDVRGSQWEEVKRGSKGHVMSVRVGLKHLSPQSIRALRCCSLCVHPSDAASKHAAQAFFDCLRAEVDEYGIVVSTISHTFIDASMSSPPKQPTAHPSKLAACEYPTSPTNERWRSAFCRVQPGVKGGHLT